MSLEQEIAGMIDHAVLHPTATDAYLIKQCEIAAKYNTASICVKPYHVAKANDLLSDSPVAVCAVIGFPHGSNTSAIKVEEARGAIKDGATEVDMVINIGKALQGDWDYVNNDIQSVHHICKEKRVILKVIFEIDYIDSEEDIIRLCEICTELGVEYVKTSTGFGFVKGNDGKYSYRGATLERVKLMKENIGPEVSVKASGGVRNLDQALAMRELGVKRIGASATVAIVEEARKREEEG